MPGKDWFCRNCNARNFARNKDCFQCDAPIDYDGERGVNMPGQKGGGRSRDGSWFCYNCSDNHPAAWNSCPFPDKDTEAPMEFPPRGGDGGTGERAATGA